MVDTGYSWFSVTPYIASVTNTQNTHYPDKSEPLALKVLMPVNSSPLLLLSRVHI